MPRAPRRLGKYRILGSLGGGGFADVYKAVDTIEGVHVALKVPHLGDDGLQSVYKEVRISATLDHPNILPIKNADVIDGKLVIATPLGDETLAERLQRRMVAGTALELAEQLLEGLAYAHGRRVIHCDVKPANMILFEDGHLRLGDFGIARVSLRTISASGSGTVGYIAPEQAMGRPSLRSDVFAAGLVIYRMLSGALPQWPYEWPLPGSDRLRRNVAPELVSVLRRAMQVHSQRRYADADVMLAAFQKALPATRRKHTGEAKKKKKNRKKATPGSPDWQRVRHREFLRHHRNAARFDGECRSCTGPVAEQMAVCPWCGKKLKKPSESTRFPASCPRCKRGRKLDWRFCAWCYGAGLADPAERDYSDVRYAASCDGPGCTRKSLMPFSRYCPWCRRRVRRKWKLEGTSARCGCCGWGVFADYWEHCPWCGKTVKRGTSPSR